MPDRFEEIYEQYKANATPEPLPDEPNKPSVVAVRKNDDDNIVALKLSDGRELDYVSALQEAKAGNIAHVDVFHKYGRDIIRSEPDGIKENNLDNLPPF